MTRVLAVLVIVTASACSGGVSSTTETVASTTAPDSNVTSTTAVVVEQSPGLNRWAGIDLIIWVEPGTGEAPLGELRRMIESFDGVLRSDYFDSEATYEEFALAVPDSVSAIPFTQRELLPTSFRVAVPRASDRATLIQAVVDHPGVRSVVISPFGASNGGRRRR